MNRAELQRLARLRIREAKVLLDNGCYEGAYYLAGYAVECALKACIAKQTRRYDFPDKNAANKSHSHDLELLNKVAGLEKDFEIEMKANPAFGTKWGDVKDWSEESRYQAGAPDAAKAGMLYDSIVNSKNGVLPWLKKRW